MNVAHVIDAPETKPVLVLSNSLGTTWELWNAQLGKLTSHFRVLRIDRLVLCCTAAYLGPPEGWFDRARLVRAGGTAAIAERVLERWFTERFRNEHQAAVMRFREMLEATSREGYAACCEAIARWDARASLGAIRAPTLVIAGEEDVATPPEDAAFLEDMIPGARLVVLPGAAHLANVQQPELFNRALLGHLMARTNSEEAA